MIEPTPELLQLRARAKGALKKRMPFISSRRRQQWLAEKMGIEQYYCIIADMDAVDLETVIDICK